MNKGLKFYTVYTHMFQYRRPNQKSQLTGGAVIVLSTLEARWRERGGGGGGGGEVRRES